jgi:hypothetical protein
MRLPLAAACFWHASPAASGSSRCSSTITSMSCRLTLHSGLTRPFSGAIADGFVWGRGTLDTKSLGIVFLLALELLVKEGAVFRRPILFTAVPDEETGGEHGMRWLVEKPA